MNITVDPKSLAAAASWVLKNYDSKNDKAFVGLVVSKKTGEGYLYHSNHTSFLKCSFNVHDIEISGDESSKGVFSRALEGRFLQGLSANIGGRQDQFTMTEETDPEHGSTGLVLRAKGSVFTIPVVKSTQHSEPKYVSLGEVDNRDFFSAMQRLSKLCDSDNDGFLPAIGAVDLKLDSANEKVVMMATDRYALGEVTMSFEPAEGAAEYVSEDNEHILLPVEDAVLIQPSKDSDATTTLIHDPKSGKFGYLFNDGRIGLFSLKDAEPLQFEKMRQKVASSTKHSMVVDVASLKKAIGTISSMVWDETTVNFTVTEDSRLIVSDSRDRNKVEVEISDVSVDRTYTISFVRSFINEAFSPIATKSMRMKWLSEKSAFVLEPVLDDGHTDENVFVFVTPKV